MASSQTRVLMAEQGSSARDFVELDQRALQVAGHVIGAEQPHDQALQGTGGLLTAAQPDRGGVAGGLELDAEVGGGGELGGGLAIEAFGNVPPSEQPVRLEGGDLLVDLGTLAPPPAGLGAHL